MSTPSHTIRPDTLDRDRFAAALRESLFRMNLTQKELAERLDVSQPTVSGWVNAQKTPGRDNLARLVEELDLQPHEVTTVQSLTAIVGPENDAIPLPHIATRTGTDAPPPPVAKDRPAGEDAAAGKDAPAGEDAGPGATGDPATGDPDEPDALPNEASGSPPPDGPAPDTEATPATDRPEKRRMRSTERSGANSIRAAMHAENPLAVLLPDAVDEDSPLHIDGYVVFSRSMLDHATPAPPDDLMVVTVESDAMSPEMPPGTSAIFSRTHREGDHGLYVLLYDASIMVKTVQRFAGGALKLTSANPAYDPEMLMPTGTPRRFRSQSTGLEVDVTVLGKVACYVKPA